MKVLIYPLVSTLLLYSATAAVTNDSGLTNIDTFELQKEEVQATYNIPDEKKANINSLGEDEEVKVLIKLKNTKGSSMVQAMSLNVAVNIERAGIIGATVTKKDMQYLEQHSDVERVELDYKVFALEEPVGNLRKLVEEVPYGIPMVLQDVDFFNSLPTPAGSIKVCVADTGYGYGHPDLPSGNAVTGTNNPAYTPDNGYTDADGQWDMDAHGHGSHCSGTVAAIGGNNKGVVGVIPNNAGEKFQLVIGKALTNSGSGSGTGVIAAIQTCVDDGAKVISLSLGGSPYSKTTLDFYNNLYENEDILFIAAAGNGGNGSYLYPASYPALMSVAAIDQDKNRAYFSQYNDQVEISGPGVSVKSTIPADTYDTWSGTSMATPHVAGVAGLLWMHFPECKNYQIRNVLAYTAKDLGDDGCDVEYGHGLVQAKAAYDLLAEGNCGDNIGQIVPSGGCPQLVPACKSDSECDDGDECTIDTCDSTKGLCIGTLKPCADCGKAEVKVEITTDKYGDETTYEIKDSSDKMIKQGGPYAPGTIYTETACASSGSYTFTIYDSYGDGICCYFGNCSYSVKVDGAEVASGGEFGYSDTKPFDVSVTSPTNSPVNPPSVVAPTPHPTQTVPTMFPTQVAPTPFPTAVKVTNSPTEAAPTNHPTESPPTEYPTQTPPTPYPTHSPPTPNPTSFPTQPPPTMFPTHGHPTMFPTHTLPTMFPTHRPPTMFPTNPSAPAPSCLAKNQVCTGNAQCCSKKCRGNNRRKVCN